MAKTNIKTVKITVPSERVLKMIKTTPALKDLTRLDLQVGGNIERVNHYQFFKLQQMFTLVGCQVEEIKK